MANEDLDWPIEEKDTCFKTEQVKITLDAQTLTTKAIESRPIHSSVSSRSSNYTNAPHLFKAYSDSNDKYNGDPKDDFDQNFSLFVEHCEQANIDHEKDRRKGFSIMLSGAALKYYFQTLKPKNLN